jgi:hypothetical protein
LEAKVIGDSSQPLREPPTLAHARRVVDIQPGVPQDLGVIELEPK